METKESRLNIDKFGQPILNEKELCELLMCGKNINNLHVQESEDIELFKKYQSELLDTTINLIENIDETLSIEEYYEKASNDWLIPKYYQYIDVKKFLLDKCTTQEQKDRVELEYSMFEERNLIMILRLFIYIIDYLRKNKFIWGVGRGSSVSSYCLYLIGTHRVDPLKYNLDIRDFLK